MDKDAAIERRIIIGLIASTEYIRQVRLIWSPELVESITARRIATWCMEYFDKYDKAPFKDIEGVYIDKLKAGKISEEMAEELEQDIFPKLNELYVTEGGLNVGYLLDQSRDHFTERRLIQFGREIQALVDSGELIEAVALASDFKPIAADTGTGLDLASEEALNRVDTAFESAAETVVHYEKELGDFWNSQLVRESLVAFMGPEKRGKSFYLLDVAMKAAQQKRNVAFFQAGDMTEGQTLRRICIYLASRSDRERYCGTLYLPVKDCIFNQLDECDRVERADSTGPFAKGQWTEESLRKGVSMEELKKVLEKHPHHETCYNCGEYRKKRWGTVWLEQKETGPPLRVDEAKTVLDKFFYQNDRRFKLSTHAHTLTVQQIRTILDIWEKQEEFVPDVIVIDYADLLEPDPSAARYEFRHQTDQIWRGLRRLSQDKHALVLTATQADAKSYEQDRLRMSNFSEDKRKLAHVTALYGLNQDKEGREKELGIMRINEIVVREDEFLTTKEIRVLQRLQMGRPVLGSFW